MSDSNENAGFSFQISETPPPAKAANGTPLADLELDMLDFGEAIDESPRPTTRLAAPELSAWLDDAPLAVPAQMTAEPAQMTAEPAQMTAEPAQMTAEPATRSAAPRATYLATADATTAQGAADEPSAGEPTVAQSPTTAEPVAAPEPPVAQSMETTEPRLAPPSTTSPLIEAAQPMPAPSLPAEPVKAEAKSQAAPAPVVAPRIKKIRFPVATAKKSQQPPRAAAKKLVSPTKFSKSISAESPRRTLDSEPEIEAPAPSAAPRPVEMAPPEDLPSSGENLDLSDAPSASWGTDTPSAREIWQKARSSWHTASRQALVIGGQGVRASRALAGTVNEKVRERLRDAAEDRKARAEFQAASSEDGVPALSQASTPTPGPGPSRAGLVILSLARTTGKKLAAPLSAVTAASLVYFAGSHLLGTDGTVALSKAVSGPEIPKLGTLDEPGSKDEKSADTASGSKSHSSDKEKPKSTGPTPMETEVTDMPEGLSWPGKGLIEVVTSTDELVYVDGVFTGRGPLRRIPVSPGDHEVSIRADGSERTGSVKVQANRNTRAVFKGE